MSKEYDYIIVGAGLFGSVFAQQAKEAGKRCLILERRDHIGGNCYTENVEGIEVHKYGAHIFHTSDKRVWDYVNRFAEFNSYVNKPKVNYNGKIYSFPINLMTLHQLYGVSTPEEARKKLEEVREPIKNPKNMEEWVLNEVGREIYEIFIKGYTTKQWKKDPSELPTSIIKRLPIRLTYNENYFFDKYQGIPIGGYTKMVERIQEGIEVITGVDFLKEREYWESKADKIVFTGPIDEFFDYSEGMLEYRSLDFYTEVLDTEDFQGNAVFNFTSPDVEWTRICEHKHFDPVDTKKTVITKEFPADWKPGRERYYPVFDDANRKIYSKYKSLAESISDKYLFGGRLAEYKYYDMHQVVASAISKAKRDLSGKD